MRCGARMLRLALAGGVLAMAVLVPMPIPYSLAYPDSLLYPAASAVALVWLWLRDRTALRVILASFLAFWPLHLALFTVLPSFALEAPDSPFRCGFMSTGFAALDQHRSGPSEFFGLVALLWVALFARHRSPTIRVLGAVALVVLARAPVPIGFFAVHAAVGAGLAGLALLVASGLERARALVTFLPVTLAVLLASGLALVVMSTRDRPPATPWIALLMMTVLVSGCLVAVFHIPDVHRRPKLVMEGVV